MGQSIAGKGNSQNIAVFLVSYQTSLLLPHLLSKTKYGRATVF